MDLRYYIFYLFSLDYSCINREYLFLYDNIYEDIYYFYMYKFYNVCLFIVDYKNRNKYLLSCYKFLLNYKGYYSSSF